MGAIRGVVGAAPYSRFISWMHHGYHCRYRGCRFPSSMCVPHCRGRRLDVPIPRIPPGPTRGVKDAPFHHVRPHFPVYLPCPPGASGAPPTVFHGGGSFPSPIFHFPFSIFHFPYSRFRSFCQKLFFSSWVCSTVAPYSVLIFPTLLPSMQMWAQPASWPWATGA